MRKNTPKTSAPRTCTVCALQLPEASFYKPYGACKECVLKKQSLHRAANRETIRARNLEYKRRKKIDPTLISVPLPPRDPIPLIPKEIRFWKFVHKTDGCWVWTGGKSGGGYGAFSLTHNHRVNAHRFSYALVHGPIPDNLQIDHLCRNPACVRPDHLEAVTPQVNSQRAKDATAYRRTHCRNGHEFTEDNTTMVLQRGKRVRRCKTCISLWVRAQAAIKGEK